MSAISIDVVARVEQVARERSDAVAVTSSEGDLPCGQLCSQARALAGRLYEQGVRQGDPVGLCLPRSADLVVGALGIVAAGGCYVALDPAYPDERLKFMVTDSGAQIVVAEADTAARINRPSVVAPRQPASSARVQLRSPSPTEPAYIVYTSGSTGRPKGVLIEHRSLANLVDWHQKAFEFTQSDRSAFISSPGFDAAVWEIWSCLATGATLIIPPDRVKTDPAALRDWLLAERITVTFVPTALCEELIALEWPATAALRTVLTGGDVLHRRPRAGLPFQVVNNYGVSEATVVATSGIVCPVDATGECADLRHWGRQ
jgi:non-ribosomal peptide synthetase component F